MNILRAVVLDASLNLVGPLLLLGFFGEVFAHISFQLDVQIV